MAEKKHFSKRGYLSYFVKNAAGEYMYNGPHYSLQTKKYGAFTAFVCAFSTLAFASSLASGLIPAPGMLNSFYVIIPFILEISVTVSVLWAAVRIAVNKKPLREYIYDATVKALPLRALFAAVFSLAGILAETVFLILNGANEKMLWCVLLYFLKAANAVLMFLLRFYVQKSVWIKADNINLV